MSGQFSLILCILSFGNPWLAPWLPYNGRFMMTSRQHLGSRPRACVSHGAQALAECPVLLQKTFISLLMRASFHYWHEYDFPTFIFLLYLEFFCVAVYKAILFFLPASKHIPWWKFYRLLRRGVNGRYFCFALGQWCSGEDITWWMRTELRVWRSGLDPLCWETTSQLAFL